MKRVLIAVDIDTSGKGNPFGLQLALALQHADSSIAVQHGTCWLNAQGYRPDVVHIHWPEALTHWRHPELHMIQSVSEALSRLREHAVIVATIHNMTPHYRESPAFARLYRTVYSRADGIIHMGQASMDAFRSRYDEFPRHVRQTIIPHGDYSAFPNQVSREGARRRLGVPQDARVALCFGAIRHPEELELLHRAYRKLSLRHKRLLIAARLPHTGRHDWRRYALRWPLRLSRSISVRELFVPFNEVQYYLNAADIVVIPRRSAMNSGNVALGFTFGRVVVGPAFGVIGETLRSSGNPTFPPGSVDGLSTAMEDGFRMASTGLGEQNASYARNYLGWPAIASQHLDFYESLRWTSPLVGSHETRFTSFL